MQSSRTHRVALCACVALLVACGEHGSGEAESGPPGRVAIIGIDGAEPVLVDRLIAEGKLPNLARLAEQGAKGTVRSLIPISSPRIWNTIATGKLPPNHGIAHFATKTDAGTRLYLSTDRTTHALWNVVSDAGMRVGVVNFWNTYPPELVDGVMVSDHLIAKNIEGRRRMSKAGEVPTAAVIHPPDWHERLSKLIEDQTPMTSFENPLRDNPDLPRYLVLVGDDLPRRFEEDGMLARMALEIEEAIHPQLLMVLMPGIDRTSHFLWGSLQEDQTVYEKIVRVGDEERAGGRAALETFYSYVDALVGLILERYDDNDLILVLSDHGFETGRRMGLLTGMHETEDAVDGIAFARGPGIAPGSRIEGFEVADVTPTILAWMGLPVAEDMDGQVAAWLDIPAPATIPTYDTKPVARMELRASGAEDEIVEQLKRLGYIE